MSHETILYGRIEGSPYTFEKFRKFQRINLDVIDGLPTQDEYPFLTKMMFSSAGQNSSEGAFRTQVIHFSSSQKGLEFDDISLWIKKFESLLSQLYWNSAIVHLETEMDGCYKFTWYVAREILETYAKDKPLPTSKWKKEIEHNGKVIESI